MEQKTDLRIIKTYKALTEALKDLLLKKPLTEITVNEICERAVVRRATFYKHFGDKYELLTFILNEMRNDISQKGEQSHLPADNGNLDFYSDIINMLEYMEADEPLFRALSDNCSSSAVLSLMIDFITHTMKEFLKQDDSISDFHSASFDLLCQLLTGAFLQGISWWLNNKERFTKPEMAEQLNSFIVNALVNEKDRLLSC